MYRVTDTQKNELKTISRLYKKTFGKSKMTAAAVSELYQSWKDAPSGTGKDIAYQKLYTSQLNLLYKSVRRIVDAYQVELDIDDIFAESKICLHNAIMKYDPNNEKKATLQTFVSQMAKYFAISYIKKTSRIVALPESYIKKITSQQKAVSAFASKHGRLPCSGELFFDTKTGDLLADPRKGAAEFKDEKSMVLSGDATQPDGRDFFQSIDIPDSIDVFKELYAPSVTNTASEILLAVCSQEDIHFLNEYIDGRLKDKRVSKSRYEEIINKIKCCKPVIDALKSLQQLP